MKKECEHGRKLWEELKGFSGNRERWRVGEVDAPPPNGEWQPYIFCAYNILRGSVNSEVIDILKDFDWVVVVSRFNSKERVVEKTKPCGIPGGLYG